MKKKQSQRMPHNITISEPENMNIKKFIPENFVFMKSSTCKDLIRHKGKYYFAFRNAPFHFPSPKAVIYILSSDDCKNWDLEKSINMKNDLREPRFLSFRGKLQLFFWMGANKAYLFRPKKIFKIQKNKDEWTQPREFFKSGYIPWRIRLFKNKAYMSVYYGKGIYGKHKKPSILLLESNDGIEWKKTKTQPEIRYNGASEPEFEFDEKGNIFGIIRLDGWGSLVFSASKKDIGRWKIKKTPYRYDSALIQKYDHEFYIISRKNMDGKSDRAPQWLPQRIRRTYNYIRYSLTKKRTAIYHLNKKDMNLRHLISIRSHGDTGFPAITKIAKNKFLLINYSSLIEPGNDYLWLTGQLRSIGLYKYIISFKKQKT